MIQTTASQQACKILLLVPCDKVYEIRDNNIAMHKKP